MTTPADVALTQLGIVEATGHNDGVPADRYMRGDKLAWCAGFAMFCYDESDWPSLYSDTGGYYRMRNVQAMEDEMKKRGCWFGPRLAAMAVPSDLIFYGSRGKSDRGRGRHVGIVVKGSVKVIGVSLTTIEGNWGDEVAQREVPLTHKDITGFARPRVA